MEKLQIFKGQNYKITINIPKGTTPETYCNLYTEFSGIYARLRRSTATNIIAKYSRDEKTGYITFIKVDDFNIKAVVDQSLTENLAVGSYYLGLAFHQLDTDFSDNTFRGCTEVLQLEILESKTDIGLE